MTRVRPLLPALLMILAVSGNAAEADPASDSPTEASTGETSPTPPQLRLPGGVRPVRYTLDLTLAPESESFSGVADIEIQFDSAQSVLWLNATELSIGEASLALGGGAPRRLRVVPGGDDFIGFTAGGPLGPGPARLHLAYTGKTSVKDLSGVFRQKEGEDWYLFTQFEPTDARRAFPCFDEPGFKVPWGITLRVRKGLTAVSNAPLAAETEATDGMRVVRFKETRPLPSYLVAFGVGPFESAALPTVGSKGVPFRVLTPKGQSAQADYTLRSTPELLALLENYFGTPYPYEKLDFLVIPLAGYAMEHPGLVTYGRRLVLAKPEDETPERQRDFANVAAHELAHMWFGNLVTMKWWDDVWLNESFASWMANKIVEDWKPEWDIPVDRVLERNQAMATDRLVSARRIRQPIESKDDIQNAFDSITYAKGSAILNMLERWIGFERFRKGVRRHLAAHAWGTADAADFLASLSAEAGSEVSPVFETFLDHGGVPLVTAGVACAPGKPSKLTLKQQRYLPVGSQGSTEQTWRIPVCVRYGLGEAAFRQCTLLTDQVTEVPLEGATACPGWLLPNDASAGYYLSRLSTSESTSTSPRPEALARLFDDGGKRLTVPERIGVLSDFSALVAAGQVPLAEVLSLVPPVVQEGNRHTVTLVAEIVQGLPLNLVPAELLPNYRRFVVRSFGARARQLGLTGKAGESEDVQLLRPSVLSLVAIRGEDEALQKKARALARRWLKDPGAVPANMVDVVLGAAARHGDAALFDQLHAAAKKASDRTQRQHFLHGMASFLDPGIVRKRMSFYLTDEFDPREATVLVTGGLDEEASREMAYSFVKANYDALVGKLPKEVEAYIAFTASSFCDEARRTDVEAFFRDRTSKAPGGPRILSQVLEQIDLCIARKKVQQPSLVTFLRQR